MGSQKGNLVDRDLESDREVEHSVEPSPPTDERLNCKINIALTNRAIRQWRAKGRWPIRIGPGDQRVYFEKEAMRWLGV